MCIHCNLKNKQRFHRHHRFQEITTHSLIVQRVSVNHPLSAVRKHSPIVCQGCQWNRALFESARHLVEAAPTIPVRRCLVTYSERALVTRGRVSVRRELGTNHTLPAPGMRPPMLLDGYLKKMVYWASAAASFSEKSEIGNNVCPSCVDLLLTR